MTTPGFPIPEATPNGSRLRLGSVKWPHFVVGLLTLGLVFQTWMVWRNVEEWEMARKSQTGISSRVAEDRLTLGSFQSRMLNELKLQTMNQMLPMQDQQRLLPTLVARLDEETRRQVLSLKLRSLQVVGEQQSTGVAPR